MSCMNHNIFHNTSCLGDVSSFYASFKYLQHPLRIPVKLHLSNISMIKQLSLPGYSKLLSKVCSTRHSGQLFIFSSRLKCFSKHFLVPIRAVGHLLALILSPGVTSFMKITKNIVSACVGSFLHFGIIWQLSDYHWFVALQNTFKLLKYEHIICSFEARNLEISNM